MSQAKSQALGTRQSVGARWQSDRTGRAKKPKTRLRPSSPREPQSTPPTPTRSPVADQRSHLDDGASFSDHLDRLRQPSTLQSRRRHALESDQASDVEVLFLGLGTDGYGEGAGKRALRAVEGEGAVEHAVRFRENELTAGKHDTVGGEALANGSELGVDVSSPSARWSFFANSIPTTPPSVSHRRYCQGAAEPRDTRSRRFSMPGQHAVRHC